MKAAGLNQTELAAIVDSTQSYISLLARGERKPSAPLAKAIAVALRADADEFLLAAGFAPESTGANRQGQPLLGFVGSLGDITYPPTAEELAVIARADKLGVAFGVCTEPGFWDQEPDDRRESFALMEQMIQHVRRLRKRQEEQRK